MFNREAVEDSSGTERQTTEILEEDMFVNANEYNPPEVGVVAS